MKKLFVGCRVRLTNSTSFKEYIGREGRIVGKDLNLKPTRPGLKSDWTVIFDGEKSIPRKKIGGHIVWLCPPSENLEPILPEGHQPVSWEECSWNPNMIKEEEAA